MNNKSYLYISSIVVVLCLWFFLIFGPYLQERKSLKTKITDQNAQLRDFETTINILPQFIAEREALKKKKDFLNSKLYTKEEVISLFDKLKEAASAQHLVVSEITPPIEELLILNSIIPDSSKPQFLNIGVRISGSYIEFAKFVKKIENESFFRGINACRIIGSRDYNKELDLYIGFKALLGRIGDKS